MIRFDKVNKRFGKITALTETSFQINEHDSVALVGNNGSGKTSVIRILCNLLPYDSGDVFIMGRRLTSNYVSYKNKIGIILSSPYFIEDFSTLEYLYFVSKFQKIDRSLIKNRINDLIELLSMENIEQKIKTLSSGAQMKVSLAAALIHNPNVLVLDEPFVNLDVKTIQKIIFLLKSFIGHKTLIMTSHDLGIIAELCNKVLILEKGKIIAELENSDFNASGNFKEKVSAFLQQTQSEFASPEWLK